MKKGTADTPLANWARGLLSKKPFKLVAVALANKIARIAWAIMARNVNFQSGAFRDAPIWFRLVKGHPTVIALLGAKQLGGGWAGEEVGR